MSHLENEKKILVTGVSSQNNLEKNDINQEAIFKDNNNRTSPNLFKKKLNTNIIVLERDFSRGQLSSGSSENESPSSSHSIKHEGDEFKIVKQDDSSTTASSQLSCTPEMTLGNGGILNGNIRCITSVFSGHAKLKRLLGTLVQFANNISTETGDTVRTLVLSLLVSKDIFFFFFFL